MAPPGDQSLERSGAEDRRRVVDADQVDVLELAVGEDVGVGDRQVVGRRQALLLRAVLGIGLHVLAEDVAGDGGDDLVGGDRAEAADRVAAHREAARRPEVGVLGGLQRQGMVDADAEVVRAVVDHVLERGDDVARPHVAAAQAGRAAVNLGDALDPLVPVLARHRVAEGGLDLAGQVIARGRERVVHPLEDGDRPAVLRAPRRCCVAGNGRKHEHGQAARGDPLHVAQVIDGRLDRLHVAAHADQDVLGVLAAIAARGSRSAGRSSGRTRRRRPPARARCDRNTTAGRSCPSCRNPGSARRRT